MSVLRVERTVLAAAVLPPLASVKRVMTTDANVHGGREFGAGRGHELGVRTATDQRKREQQNGDGAENHVAPH